MLYLASDYAGYRLKVSVKNWLARKKISFRDIGSQSRAKRDDFTDYIPAVVRQLKKSKSNRAVLVCGTGYGMAIGANRFPGIRATLATDARQAKFSRTHDNSNVLVLSAWFSDKKNISRIVKAWLKTPFQALPRRVRRFKVVDTWPT